MERKKLLFLSIVLFVLASIGMGVVDVYMQNEITPYGIISFEFIKTIEASNAAMQAWGPTGQIATGISVGLDFLYLVMYISIGCIFLAMTSEKVSAISPSFGRALLILAYLYPVVGLLDVIENYSLIQLLLGSQDSIWPTTAYYCAITKFGGLAIAWVFVIFGQVYAKLNSPKSIA